MSKLSRKLKEFFNKWFGNETPAEIKEAEAESILDISDKIKERVKNESDI